MTDVRYSATPPSTRYPGKMGKWSGIDDESTK